MRFLYSVMLHFASPSLDILVDSAAQRYSFSRLKIKLHFDILVKIAANNDDGTKF